MTATVRLPRILTQAVSGGVRQEIDGGGSLREALDRLFVSEPGLRNHLLNDQGAIRTHVLDLRGRGTGQPRHRRR